MSICDSRWYFVKSFKGYVGHIMFKLYNDSEQNYFWQSYGLYGTHHANLTQKTEDFVNARGNARQS